MNTLPKRNNFKRLDHELARLIHYAIENDDTDMLEKILTPESIELTLNHIVEAYMLATEYGKEKPKSAELIARKIPQAQVSNFFGRTVLCGTPALLAIMLERGLDVQDALKIWIVRMHREDSRTVENMRFLLDRGADINKPLFGDVSTLFMFYALEGDEDVLVELVEKYGADPLANWGRYNALDVALYRNLQSLAQALISRGASPSPYPELPHIPAARIKTLNQKRARFEEQMSTNPPVTVACFASNRVLEKAALLEHMKNNPKPNYLQYFLAMQYLSPDWIDTKTILEDMESKYNLDPVIVFKE